MSKPTEIRGEAIFIDSTPPGAMTEDRLSKRMTELESYVCSSLVLRHRAGEPVPADLIPAIEHYGEMWDESWNR